MNEDLREARERERYWQRRLDEIPEGEGEEEASAKYNADREAEDDELWARDQGQKEAFGMVIILLFVCFMAIVRGCT